MYVDELAKWGEFALSQISCENVKKATYLRKAYTLQRNVIPSVGKNI